MKSSIIRISVPDRPTPKGFRFFGELQSGLENGRKGGPRLTDLDKLDIHQAFVDIGLLQHEHHKLTLRLGRQEVRLAREGLFRREKD
jgi:hypothetical protein